MVSKWLTVNENKKIEHFIKRHVYSISLVKWFINLNEVCKYFNYDLLTPNIDFIYFISIT